MDDKDITLVPGNGTSPLAGKLQRIAGYERGRGPTVPRVIRSVGRTRAYAAFYRWYGPKADPWLLRKVQGRGVLRIGFPALLLTTTGAKSGLPRVMPLIYVRDGDDFVVVGTNFGQRHHPGRTANLLARADASVVVGREHLPVTGELADPATWQRLWPRFVALCPGYADYLTHCALESRVCSGCTRALPDHHQPVTHETMPESVTPKPRRLSRRGCRMTLQPERGREQ